MESTIVSDDQTRAHSAEDGNGREQLRNIFSLGLCLDSVGFPLTTHDAQSWELDSIQAYALSLILHKIKFVVETGWPGINLRNIDKVEISCSIQEAEVWVSYPGFRTSLVFRTGNLLDLFPNYRRRFFLELMSPSNRESNGVWTLSISETRDPFEPKLVLKRYSSKHSTGSFDIPDLPSPV